MPDIIFVPATASTSDINTALGTIGGVYKAGVTLPLTNQDAEAYGLDLDVAYKTRVLGTAGDLEVAAPSSGATVSAVGTAAQNGFTTSLNVPVPATVSTDQILIAAWITVGATPGVPANFTLLYSVTGTGGGGDLYLWKWDGTGTRPDNANVAVTLGASGAIRAQAFVCTGSGTGNGGTKAKSGATAHQSASFSVTAGSIVLVIWTIRSDTSFTTSYTGTTPDETTLSPPDDAGRLSGWQQTGIGGVVQVIPEASSGTTNRMTLTTSFNTLGGLAVEILA